MLHYCLSCNAQCLDVLFLYEINKYIYIYSINAVFLLTPGFKAVELTLLMVVYCIIKLATGILYISAMSIIPR